MTETSQATVNPHMPPEGVEGNRAFSARWDIGTPDSEGFQKKVTLRVDYHKGHGYRAVLSTIEVQQRGVIVSEKFSFRDPACWSTRRPRADSAARSSSR